MWSGAARSTPSNDKTDRKKPSAWRKGNRKTRRSVNAVSIAQFENVFGAPGRPDGDGRHASVASAESHRVTSPRWTKACSYADPFPTRYVVLYFGWTFDLMSRSCTRSGHRGQRAYSCLVAAEGLCTNAAVLRQRREPTSPGEILREEFLLPLDMTQKRLAKHLRCDVKVVNRLVNGRTSVSAPMALKLGATFGTTPDFWLNAQKAVDIYRALHDGLDLPRPIVQAS